MIYIDVSQLSRFVRAGKQVSGIQRLTLNSFVGLTGLLGDGHVGGIVYDEAQAQFRRLSVTELFGGGSGHHVQFSKNDKLLFMEWYWNQAVFEAGLKAGKTEGAHHFRFIHDVIPVARPEFVRGENTRRFKANTELALHAADVVLTNSDYSGQDILRHFPIAATKPLHVVKLPHEFSIVDGGGIVRPITRDTKIAAAELDAKVAALSGQNYVLMVGTLEERKNTLLAVKMWQRLCWKHGSNFPKLVLVGFYSAHSIPYTASLMVRTATSRNIVHLSNCSDLELAWLYQHCLFSLYISQYEGWGLPIGESLWFGKPVVAQNNSSLPEVGGPLVDQVGNGRLEQLEDACEKLNFDHRYRASREANIESQELRRWA